MPPSRHLKAFAPTSMPAAWPSAIRRGTCGSKSTSSGTRLPMIASPFYHRLHITQLRVMHRITAEAAFAQYADRWESYLRSALKRTRALCYKGAFKLCYY